MSQDSPTGSFRSFVFTAEAVSTHNMRKEADVHLGAAPGDYLMSYQFACDESEILGGDNSAPPPLSFFTVSIAFCLMTQISRYAHMRKLQIDKLHMVTTAHYHNEGSVLQGTIQGIIDKIESEVHIDSPEPREVIDQLLADAERGCYVHYALTHPMTVENSLVYNRG